MTVKPEGRKLLRVETRNAQTPIENKPWWIRNQVRPGPSYRDMKNRISGASLHTVYQEAGCPNVHECWEDRKATSLIGGGKCTRRCGFCQTNSAKPDPLGRDEPRRVAESVHEMGLRYAAITGVARDDLPDDTFWLYVETCHQIHELSLNTGIELLIDDFRGDEFAAQQVFDAKLEVFARNLKMVPCIFKRIRLAFRYKRSLELVTRTRGAGLVTKSNLVLDMGESYDEIVSVMEDLHGTSRDVLMITQYLRPTPLYHPIGHRVKPEEFVKLSEAIERMGFAGVMSGPLVRSSHRVGRLYAHTLAHRSQEPPAHLSALAGNSDSNLTLQEVSTLLDRYGASEDTPVISTIPAP